MVYGKGKYYIGAVKYGVNLGFSIQGLPKEKRALFDGNGKTMRHKKYVSLEGINAQEVEKLLKLVQECKDC